MIDKLKKLLNLRAWIENAATKFLLTKGVKHATAGVLGLLTSVFFTTKVKPILDQFGIQIDTIHLAESLTVLFTGLAGSLMNWITKVIYHGDEATAAKEK